MRSSGELLGIGIRKENHPWSSVAAQRRWWAPLPAYGDAAAENKGGAGHINPQGGFLKQTSATTSEPGEGLFMGAEEREARPAFFIRLSGKRARKNEGINLVYSGELTGASRTATRLLANSNLSRRRWRERGQPRASAHHASNAPLGTRGQTCPGVTYTQHGQDAIK